MYEGLRTDDLKCAMFNVIFMARRAIMALIIIFMHELNGP